MADSVFGRQMRSSKSQQNEFKIAYQGILPQIDATTFINSLTNITTIIESINNDLITGKKIEIKIKGLDKGSFLVHLQLLAESLKDSALNLITHQNIGTGAAIVGILLGLLEIRKHLLGKKAKKVDIQENKVSIENEKGIVIYTDNTTYNIYKNNTIVRGSIGKNFETLDDDPAVTGFELKDINEKPLLTIEKEDFKPMSIDEEKTDEGIKTEIEETHLNIFKIVFEENYKWQFYYQGIKIPAKIADAEFLKKIDLGESFAKGDILKVELEITKEFDPSVNTFINKSYAINKVIEHIPRIRQSNLDFKK